MEFYSFYLEDLLIIALLLLSLAIIPQAFKARKGMDSVFKKGWYSFVLLFGAVCFLFFGSSAFSGIRIMRADGVSMEPTMDQHNIMIANVYSYGVRVPFLGWIGSPSSPEKGDVVALKALVEGEFVGLTKRVIATEGDVVRYEAGVFFVNGDSVLDSFQSPESRLSGDVILDIEKATLGEHHFNVLSLPYDFQEVEMVVPPGQVFIAGDNWGLSYDSRHFGAVSIENIRGKVVYNWSRISGWKRI